MSLNWVYEMPIYTPSHTTAVPQDANKTFQWHDERMDFETVHLNPQTLSENEKRIIYYLYDLIDSRLDISLRGDRGLTTRLTMAISSEEMDFLKIALQLKHPNMSIIKRIAFPGWNKQHDLLGD
eukprot:TRINITY_DN12041_c0_g1_i1.p1 TRINITY_DN12041_c0_g1~~TRINITY_DN12041_c0_g1_i1.p1  ORF type:complete len:124 (+),score=13.31 TRINITY_DN12041_c0_g1_i1:378-749(+)